MSDNAPPFSVMFDLGSLSDAGAEVRLAPTGAEKAAIAKWLDIPAVDQLNATVRLSRTGDGEYTYRASFAADVVQACVVTLEDVPSHVEGEFERLFRIMPRLHGSHRRKADAAPASSIELSSLEDDDPELLESSTIDLAAPVLEEVSLALDPYPRAP